MNLACQSNSFDDFRIRLTNANSFDDIVWRFGNSFDELTNSFDEWKIVWCIKLFVWRILRSFDDQRCRTNSFDDSFVRLIISFDDQIKRTNSFDEWFVRLIPYIRLTNFNSFDDLPGIPAVFSAIDQRIPLHRPSRGGLGRRFQTIPWCSSRSIGFPVVSHVREALLWTQATWWCPRARALQIFVFWVGTAKTEKNAIKK